MTRGGLTFLFWVWVILGTARCFVACEHLPPTDAAARPRSFDMDPPAGLATQEVSRGATGGGVESSPGAFLQVGLMQIACSGLDEALLAACEVPLHLGVQQHVDLQFGSPGESAWNGPTRRLLGSSSGVVRRDGLPESFGDVSRRIRIDFVWHGESPTGHLLQVIDDRSEHSDRSAGSAGHGRGGLCLPSAVLAWRQPWLFAQLHRGNVLIFRIVDKTAAAGEIGTVDFWRRACAGLADASPRVEVPAPRLGTLATVRTQHPFVVPDPFESACLASIVFRDRPLAAVVLAKRGDYIGLPIRTWPDDSRAFYVEAWGWGNMAAVATLLGDGSVMPWSVGEFGFQHAVAWRCLLLQEDPAMAAAIVDAMLPRLRTNSLFAMLLRHSQLTVAPPVAAAWERLRSAAIGELGIPWNCALAVPGGLILYLLLPFALGIVVATGRVRSRPRAPLGRGMLLMLFLGAFLTLGDVAMRPVLALCVVVTAVADVRSSPARSVGSRLLILLAVAGTVFVAARGTRFEVQLLPLGVFADACSVLVWLLIGWRVLEEGRWRSPGCYSVFLLVVMLAWSLTPIRPTTPVPRGFEWIVVVACGAFALFLLRGRLDRQPVGSMEYAGTR